MAALALAMCVACSLTARGGEYGRLYIKTRPARANVYLDDEQTSRGRTPCYIRGVEPGTHTVRVSMEGHSTETESVDILPGETSRMTLELVNLRPRGRGVVVSQTKAATEAPREPAAAKLAPCPLRRPPPWFIEADCPACKGTGALQTIGCDKCKGSGQGGHGGCEKCDGSGREPYRCAGCDGIGTIAHGGVRVDCRKCHGKGRPSCLMCAGTGHIKRANPARVSFATTACATCDGSGFHQVARCRVCGAKGTIRYGRKHYYIKDCWHCHGKGVAPPLCMRCRGFGLGGPDKNRGPCRGCYATGRLWHPCASCGGRGWVKSK